MKEFDRRGLHRPWGTKQTTKSIHSFQPNSIHFIHISDPNGRNEKKNKFIFGKRSNKSDIKNWECWRINFGPMILFLNSLKLNENGELS
jgi:hypothetical protein